MSRIPKTFKRLKSEGRAALMPYLTIGYPEKESAKSLVPAIEASGADMMELGIPFSDPLADGPTVQASTQKALTNGVNLRYCLETVAELRAAGVKMPFAFMGYYNPIYQMGIERFAAAAKEAGVDALIVPDLPPEEAEPLDEALKAHDIDYIYFLAPTSDESRLQLVAQKARGFIYLVSLVGVTGARNKMSTELPAFIERVRRATKVPLAVGFGISTPETARAVGELADGVIVGSALIKRVSDPATAEAGAREFVGALRQGLEP
ncbi:MAG: tryptophan synthase subunit alpha [Ardenticatenaceae bacterium]